MSDVNGVLRDEAGAFIGLDQGVDKSPPIEQEDSGRWELDTNPFLDRVYHELLGESLDEGTGSWIDDIRKPKVMNPLGATEFIQEISTRISIHMQLSDLEDKDIIDIASRASEVYADKLEDNWRLWDIRPTEANLNSIAVRLYDVLFITLRIARKGGMKKHRERYKTPSFMMPQGGGSQVEGGI